MSSSVWPYKTFQSMPNLLMLDGPVDNVLGPLQHLVVLAGLVASELTLIVKT